MHIAARWAAVLMVLAASRVQSLAGSFELTRTGDLYSLTAHDARLSDILKKIDDLEAASLRLFSDDDRTVNATYRNKTIDQLLSRLNVSYMLVYEGNEEEGYHLGDALLIGSDADRIDPERRRHIAKLVRDLFSDDIRGNAHHAQWELMELGCDAVPELEKALYSDDYQGVQMAGSLLRQICPDYKPSDKLIEITLRLMNRNGYDADEYWSLFAPSEAFRYILDTSNIYARVRDRLVSNLNSADRQERLLSALLLAERGEVGYADRLVRILVPHLADNDMKSDGAAAAHALYRIGPNVLPYLSRYRTSSDMQQSEMVDLICRALETGTIPEFNPVMYVGYDRNPLDDEPYVNALYWTEDKFPDDDGIYHNLGGHRMGVREYYGPWSPTEEELETAADEVDSGQGTDGLDGVDVPFTYTARLGDTLESVAWMFAVAPDAIRQLNPEVVLDPLVPGTKLKIPVQL